MEPIVSDIADLTVDELMDAGDFDATDVDVIIGGPPCKGFSLAGERDPDDPRNKLWQEYLRIVEKLAPSAVVIENVKGILSLKGGEYKTQILTELRNLGYNTHFSLLTAADYGEVAGYLTAVARRKPCGGCQNLEFLGSINRFITYNVLYYNRC